MAYGCRKTPQPIQIADKTRSTSGTVLATVLEAFHRPFELSGARMGAADDDTVAAYANEAAFARLSLAHEGASQCYTGKDRQKV